MTTRTMNEIIKFISVIVEFIMDEEKDYAEFKKQYILFLYDTHISTNNCTHCEVCNFLLGELEALYQE